MSAANALLVAIHARLAADPQLVAMIGTDGIRDRLLPRPVLPTLVMGEMETRDYSTATEAGEEHRLVLEVWSDAAGRREAEELAERVRGLLQDAALTLAGHLLVSLAHERTRTRRQANAKLFLAELRFRAVTEPLEPVSP
ncbi:DUF3168 domain-containing protein [Pseudorhizobium flavum]|jgi:hypothetical protein|uniref:DUF3168 domain-containing protein n=1 Tax=Pseudorhizobium flavum TaxID=1335061 RepID=UPI00376F5D0A